MRTLLDTLMELVWPACCACCQAPGGLACPSCLAAFGLPPRRVWPTPCPAGMPPTWSVADYTGAARDLLLAYKERDAIGLGRWLALPLASAVGDATGGRIPVDLVPVPSTSAAIRARGDDVVAVLARLAARQLCRTGQPARVVAALRQRRAVADSAGLSATERQANLGGALAVRPGASSRLAGRSVVLVDDLVTTGATLAEATRALREVGVVQPVAATVAATRRRSSESATRFG